MYYSIIHALRLLPPESFCIFDEDGGGLFWYTSSQTATIREASIDRFHIVLPFMALCSMAHATMHVADEVDFIAGRNTNGWTLTAQGWTSPTYPTNVASFSLVGTNLSDGANLSVAYARNAFTIVPAGGARPVSFTARYTVSQLPPPEGLALTNMIDGAFDASWRPVEDAIGYRVTIYSNHVEGAAAGNPLLSESFDAVPGKGTVTAIDGDTFDSLTDTQAGWRIQTCYHAVTPLSGVIQVGSSTALGWMALPVPPSCIGAGRTLRLVANRFANAGRDMPIAIVSADGTSTNSIGSVALGETPSAHFLALPELRQGDTIYLNSTTNKMANKDKDGRVALDSVCILEGYDPGETISELRAVIDTAGTTFSTNGLPPFVGMVTVVALAANPSDNSAAASAALDLVNPPPMPILRAVPLSQCLDGVYVADFSPLSNVTSAATWRNGVWPIPYWMGYNDRGEVVTSVRKASVNTTYSGFFAFSSAYDPTIGWALGLRGTASRDFHCGVALLNDTDTPRSNFEITLDYLQWNYRNEIPMTNTVEWLVTNALVGTAAAGDWIPVPSLTMTPPYTATYNDGGAEHWRGGPRTAALPGVTLDIGEYLIVRMTARRSPSSGGIALAGFRVASTRKTPVNCIIFR